MATTPAAVPNRTFTQTLEAMRFGELSDELTRHLRDLTLQVDDRKRPGTLVLTIKLKPGSGGQIELVDDIKVTAPKPEKGSTLMFAGPEGYLQRNDPRQRELDGIRSVNTDEAPARRVG